jgi:hypothetical protein
MGRAAEDEKQLPDRGTSHPVEIVGYFDIDRQKAEPLHLAPRSVCPGA